MTSLHFFYLLSLSLQIAGSFILIYFCWGKTKSLVFNTIFPANTAIHREEDNTVIICKHKLINAHKKILLNRIAFIFIGMGYLLSVFGSNEGLCRWMGMLLIVIMSAIIMALGVMGVCLIAKLQNKKDYTISYEHLCLILESDVNANLTNTEIDEIVNNIMSEKE